MIPSSTYGQEALRSLGELTIAEKLVLLRESLRDARKWHKCIEVIASRRYGCAQRLNSEADEVGRCSALLRSGVAGRDATADSEAALGQP